MIRDLSVSEAIERLARVWHAEVFECRETDQLRVNCAEVPDGRNPLSAAIAGAAAQERRVNEALESTVHRVHDLLRSGDLTLGYYDRQRERQTVPASFWAPPDAIADLARGEYFSAFTGRCTLYFDAAEIDRITVSGGEVPERPRPGRRSLDRDSFTPLYKKRVEELGPPVSSNVDGWQGINDVARWIAESYEPGTEPSFPTLKRWASRLVKGSA